MNIRHECPLPDLSFQVAAPLFIRTVDGQKLRVERWSLKGLRFDEPTPVPEEGAELVVPFQGVEVAFPITLKQTENACGLDFVDLTVRQRETLSSFYNGVLSGRMVSTGDIITSLDTPVDLVPMEETQKEKSAGVAKEKPRFLRTIWNVVFYVGLAAFLVGVVGNQIWGKLSELTLDHGRFVAPIVQYAAPDSGYVEKVYVRVGDKVRKGDVIFRLEDPDRESDVEEVRAEVLIAERRLLAARGRLEAHKTESPRYRSLYWEKFFGLWYPWKAHEPRALVYPPEIQLAWEELRRFDLGLLIGPASYHGILARLQAVVDETDLDYRRWKRELRHRKAAADEFLVRSRSDGTVFAVPTKKGSFVGRGDLVAEIEDDQPRQAVGWLDDRLATSVYIGMPATLRYSFRGESKNISGHVVDIQAGIDTVQPDKYGMVVTVKASDAGLMKSRKWFRPNAPARIDLQRFSIKIPWQEQAQ